MKRSFTHSAILAGGLALLLSGCASTGGSWTNTKTACTVAGALVGGAIAAAADDDSSDREDAAVLGGLVGAVAGALLCPEKKAAPAPAPAPVAAAAPAPAPPPPPAPPKDSDGDGVIDDNDRCPGTPEGMAVDSNGCPPDSDADGVADVNDQCPYTHAGKKVNAFGCDVAKAVRLDGVNFEFNSAQLTADSTAILDSAASVLANNPGLNVEVAGHTDSSGPAAYNKGLSDRRANAVRDYLIAHGASASQLTANGYGESQPVADNGTRAGRKENRRVELRVK